MSSSKWFAQRPASNMVLGIVLLGVFVGLAGSYQRLAAFDQSVYNYLYGLASPWLTILMQCITHLGSAPVTIGIAIAFFLYAVYRCPRKQLEATILAFCLAGAWLLNEGLKALFRRARPELVHLVQVRGYSFPSGHAMISFAFYGLISYLLWQRGRRRVLAVGCLLLSIFIGVSRIYLGVHFSSDVLAGFAAGGIWLNGCLAILQRITYRRKP